jgi:hypothetical protein
MSVTHVLGIDPGLVHTGMVWLSFVPKMREVQVRHHAVAGPDIMKIQRLAGAFSGDDCRIFIEAYRPRSAFNTDARMGEAVSTIRVATGGTVLDNTGVKKVVKQPLMELLGVWKFATPTHHQDLRSAARIALLGMLRDERLNTVVANVVRDHLDGNTWTRVQV